MRDSDGLTQDQVADMWHQRGRVTPPRKVNPSVALSCAEDDFREEVHAFYEVAAGSIASDLFELEAVARLTLAYAKSVETLMGRMEFAAFDDGYALSDLLLDVLSDKLQHGAGAVVRAQVMKMGAGS